jgi:hypothetical protein
MLSYVHSDLIQILDKNFAAAYYAKARALVEEKLKNEGKENEASTCTIQQGNLTFFINMYLVV